MRVYLDTNVILTRYVPDEPQHDESKSLMNKIEAGQLEAVTSLLTFGRSSLHHKQSLSKI